MRTVNNLKKDERGLAAITITVFILIVLSLLVLAFSQIARREQRQSLDRELSTAAFYVAESGINDATKYLRDPGNQAAIEAMDFEKKECASDPVFNPSLDNSDIFKESCVLFDKAPDSLEWGAIDDYKGEFVSLQTASGSPPRSITIEWQDTDGGSSFGGCVSPGDLTNFPDKVTYASDCDASMLKIILMPVVNGSINRERLVDDSFSVYLRPVNGSAGSTVSYSRHASGPDNEGFVAPADCTSGQCRVTINNILPSNDLFLRISSVYNSSAVKITGNDGAGLSVRFTKAQAKIDSTGKANDVLKRVQVRIPLLTEFELPPYTLESMNGICKRLDVYPGGADNSDCGGIN